MGSGPKATPGGGDGRLQQAGHGHPEIMARHTGCAPATAGAPRGSWLPVPLRIARLGSIRTLHDPARVSTARCRHARDVEARGGGTRGGKARMERTQTTSKRPQVWRAMVGAAVAVAVGAGVPAAMPRPAAADYGDTITVLGHGYGHGRGLGQWGSYGYALQGWTYRQILDRYYGGTTVATLPDTTQIAVRLLAFDGQPLVVVQDAGALTLTVGGGTLSTPGPYRAVKITKVGTNSFSVASGTACNGGVGGWVDLGTVSGAIQASVPAANQDAASNSAVSANLLGACQPSGSVVYYRGTLTTIDDGGTQRSVDTLGLDRYVRGVVPRESPSGWGAGGGGKGIEALKAQSVAARSYAAAETRYGYANTCDSTACQVYGGAAMRSSAAGALTPLDYDDPTNIGNDDWYRYPTQAVAATAYEVRKIGAAVARTEFSSSTGGYTAGGTFPAVTDDGDAVSGNPYHLWTATIRTADITSRYSSLGTLRSIDVTKRNGLGDWGGRAQTVVLRGSSGSVTLTGDAFRMAFGLRSDWFYLSSSYLDVPAVGVANASGDGYWIVANDGGVYGVNGAPFYGSMAGQHLNKPMIGMASSGTGGLGYWLLATDGGIFAYGDARFYGSTGAIKLNKPVVAMTARPQGDGYWFVATDGGVFAYGSAGFLGSMGAVPLNKPVVGMAATASGQGYWLVASDGGMFAFGDAVYYGSTGDHPGPSPIVAMAARPQGDGYWLVAADGSVTPFGAARFYGSATALTAGETVVGISVTSSGRGYRLVSSRGAVASFGDANSAARAAPLVLGPH